MSEDISEGRKKGCGYLTCLPTTQLCLGLLSLRLGSLIISIYSCIHAGVAGYNPQLLERRELEINLNAIFCLALILVSLLLMLGVFLEQQGLCLLWLWFVLIMFIPMAIVLGVVASIHMEMQFFDIAYRNFASLGMHVVLLYCIMVIHSYRCEIEALEDINFDSEEEEANEANEANV